jgi:hypothetical protein
VHRVENEHLVLEVALGDCRPSEAEDVDAWVTLPDGSRWTATFVTVAQISRLMERWQKTGECLGGRYFAVRPDLVIIRDPGVDEMLAVATELVATGEHESTLHRIA